MKILTLRRDFLKNLRTSEFVAGASLMCSLLLFIHTANLQSQLHFYQKGRKIDSWTQQTHEDSIHKVDEENQMNHQFYNNEKLFQFDRSKLNITKLSSKLILLFNRVPKAGSQSIMQLLKSLSYLNGFTFHKDRPQKSENIKMTLREQKQLTRMIDSFRPPTMYAKHVCFLNFTKFNLTQPIYVNMVRDPVERAISWFYYVRAPWYFVERKKAFPYLQLPSSVWLRKDYESCVLNGDKECTYEEGDQRPDFAQLTEFFCGQEDECTGLNTEYALTKAKENVEKYYAVVGILEDMNTTLTVFESYLPQYFRNAKKVYWDHSNQYSKINRNIYKPPVSEEVKNLVRKNFTREIEFYEFCKQRLYSQYSFLNEVKDL